jgi:hypothetical protein
MVNERLQRIKRSIGENFAEYGLYNYKGLGRVEFEQINNISASEDIQWLISEVERLQTENDQLRKRDKLSGWENEGKVVYGRDGDW